MLIVSVIGLGFNILIALILFYSGRSSSAAPAFEAEKAKIRISKDELEENFPLVAH